MARLDTEVRHLLAARAANDKAQKAAERTKQALDDQQQIVWKMLKDQGLKTITLEVDGEQVQIGRRETIRSRVFNLEGALEWLRENERLDEMSKPEIRKAPMNELVRELLETHQKLPTGVDFTSTKYIQVTRR